MTGLPPLQVGSVACCLLRKFCAPAQVGLVASPTAPGAGLSPALGSGLWEGPLRRKCPPSVCPGGYCLQPLERLHPARRETKETPLPSCQGPS